MGGAASIQDIGADIAGIDDADLQAKMSSVLETLSQKGLEVTAENFENEAKVNLNAKDYERAVSVVKSKYEGKLSGNSGSGGRCVSTHWLRCFFVVVVANEPTFVPVPVPRRASIFTIDVF